MIDKPVIIITSLGRTGTKFFATLFDEILDDCRSLHEPDVFGVPLNKGPGLFFSTTKQKIELIGWQYIVLQKFSGNFSIAKISDSRITGTLSSEVAVKKFLKQRYDFLMGQPGRTYLESSAMYYGLIDLLPEIFTEHRLGYIVRDGRYWIRSVLNWGEFYAKSRLRGLIAHTWPRANQFPEDPYFEAWDTMNRFERLCWAWNKFNNYALESISKNPHARLFRFEDLFTSADKYDRLSEFVTFLTEIHGGRGRYKLDGWLDKKIHASSKAFPEWNMWSSDEKRTFREHCGKTMTKLSYEI